MYVIDIKFYKCSKLSSYIVSGGHQERDYSISMLDFHLEAADKKAEILLEFGLIL